MEGELVRRTFKAGALFCAIAALAFGILYGWRGPVEFAAPNILAAAMLAAIAFLPMRTAMPQLYLAVTVGLLLFGYQLMLLGRVDNGVAVWFIVPFSAAMLLGLHRLAAYSGTITAIQIIGVVAAARAGWLDARVVIPESDLVMASSIISVMSLVGLFALITQRARRQLIREIEMSNTSLATINKELESFAYSISHDLRAPLRGIDGFSHMLAEEYGNRLDAEGNGYLDRIRAAAQRMGALIDDILELSRVSRRTVRSEKVDLGRIAHEVLDELAQADPARRVGIAIEEECIVTGDPQLLRIMMQNLLENAWKYTGREPAPKIGFGSETIEGERVFYVRDNGVGFDMKYADRLFSPFQRLHKPEEFEGTGIGLATVARVVHGHGGRVWAESEPGKGTTLRFALPSGVK